MAASQGGEAQHEGQLFHFSRQVGIELFKNIEKLLNLNVSE